MNLGQIETAIYDRIGSGANADSATVRRVRRAINDAHKKILGKRGFSRLRRAVLTCSSVANSPYMVLPQAASKIIVISDRSNNRNLLPVSVQDLRYADPGVTSSGAVPNHYAIISFGAAVAAQPSVADSLFIISDSAVDGSGLAVTVEGITTGGYQRRASVTLNGLTGVNINSAITTWEFVQKFHLSGAAKGNVTLRQTSGAGTELSHIPPGHTNARYTQVHLSPTPTAAQVFYCDIELYVSDMMSPNEEPLLPDDYHWILGEMVMCREYLKKEKPQLYKLSDMATREGMSDLKAHLASRGGVSTAGQRRSGGGGFSQLGSYFPAGS